MDSKLFSINSGGGGGSPITLPVSIADGGTGQTTATLAFNALNPMTTKGDMIVHNGTNAVRQAVGANGSALIADSSQSTGVKWGNPTGFYDFGNSGTGITLDFALGSFVKVTLTSASPTLTLSDGSAGGIYVLEIAQDGTGGRLAAFSPAINWGTLGAPTLSTGINKIDFITLATPDGSTYYGLSYVLGY